MFEHIRAIQKTNQSTSKIIRQMMRSKQFKNENDAFVVLRASLKTLRDRINPDEAIHLGAQLPALLRGFYFEHWNFSQKTNLNRKSGNFLTDARRYLNGHREINIDKTVPVALKAILDAIDEGEAKDVLSNLPKEIQHLCSSEGYL